MADLATVDSRAARPGDPDLDFHLIGLRLGPVVSLSTGDYDIEATIAFDTSEAAGWWIDSETGERTFPDQVNELTVTFGMHLDDESGHLAAEVMRRLSAWAKSGSLIAMTSAPEKWTLLHCPEHPAGTLLVLPRRMPALAAEGGEDA